VSVVVVKHLSLLHRVIFGQTSKLSVAAYCKKNLNTANSRYRDHARHGKDAHRPRFTRLLLHSGSELPRQVSTWLSELGLPQYEKVLSGNGFDDVDFLVCSSCVEVDYGGFQLHFSVPRFVRSCI